MEPIAELAPPVYFRKAAGMDLERIKHAAHVLRRK